MTLQSFITVIDQNGDGWTLREGDREIDGPEKIPAVTETGEPIAFLPDAVKRLVQHHQIQTGQYEPPDHNPERSSQ